MCTSIIVSPLNKSNLRFFFPPNMQTQNKQILLENWPQHIKRKFIFGIVFQNNKILDLFFLILLRRELLYWGHYLWFWELRENFLFKYQFCPFALSFLFVIINIKRETQMTNDNLGMTCSSNQDQYQKIDEIVLIFCSSNSSNTLRAFNYC